MRSITFLLLASFAATSGKAAPGTDDNTISMTVDVGELQLTSDAHVRRLNRRVLQLANVVCTPPGTRSVRELAEFNACRVAALRDGQRQLQFAVAAARARDNTRFAAAGSR